MKNILLLTMLGALTGTAAAGGGLTIVLDGFDADPNDDAGGPRAVSSTEVANPFGQPSDFFVDTAFNAGGSIGAAIFNSGIGVEQQGVINWDNNGTGLNLDAAGLGIVGFELDFLLVDQDFNLQVVLGTIGGGTATTNALIAAGGSRTESIALGGFDFGAGFDAGDVDSVTITFNSSSVASLDFVVTEFRAVVPAPGALALLGLGGLAAARRRR